MKRIHNYSCSGLTLQSESFFPVFSSLYIRIDICHSVCINKFIILFIQLVSQRKPVVSSFTIFSVFTCPLWYSKNRAAVRIISYDTPVHIYKNWGINKMDKRSAIQWTLQWRRLSDPLPVTRQWSMRSDIKYFFFRKSKAGLIFLRCRSNHIPIIQIWKNFLSDF